MPNIKSAIKRVSVIEHKTLRNKMVKSATKTAIKKFDAATATKTATAELLSSASSAVDKAAAKGVISKNTITPLIPPPSPLPRLPFYSSKSLGAPNMYPLASYSTLVHSRIALSLQTSFPARAI